MSLGMTKFQVFFEPRNAARALDPSMYSTIEEKNDKKGKERSCEHCPVVGGAMQ